MKRILSQPHQEKIPSRNPGFPARAKGIPAEEYAADPAAELEQDYAADPAAKLEQDYETSLKTGLTAGEVNRRLSENRWEYLAKEKKRSWIRSAEQECLDPLFFFLIFLCAFLFLVGEKEWLTALPAPVLVSILKMRQVMRNHRFLEERKTMFLPKAQVFRDGTYQYIDVREIVSGDILRLKKGAKVPVTVHSLTKSGVIYEKGEKFPEESGRAVAAGPPGSTVLKKQGILPRILSGSASFPLRAQEMLFQRGVTVMDGACLPDSRKKKAVILDTECFPSVLRPHAFQKLIQFLNQNDIRLIFFTDQNRETAFDILNQLHVTDNKRDIIDAAQFSCYLEENRRLGKGYERQMNTIRAYAGLDRQSKRKVMEAWRDGCQWLYIFPDRSWSLPEEWQEEEKKISWLGFLDGRALDREFYFRKHWSEGLFQLLQGEYLWNAFVTGTEKIQEKVLAALCIFNGVMLLAGIFEGARDTFHWMFLISSLVCGGVALWKELWWQWLRRKRDL